MIYLTFSNIIIAPLAILTPLLVTRTFGAEPFYLTLNEIVFFIGNILGGILLSVWGGFKNKIHTIGVGCLICGLFSILMGLPSPFILYLLWMGLTGITMPMFNTPFITLFQETVSPDKQGRVFSLISIISGIIMPLAMVFFGPLADRMKIEYILIATGILLIVGAIVFLKDNVIQNIMKISERE